MKSTDDRSLIPVAIAADAATDYIRTIPTTQATAGDGSVSIDLGFPPECAISTTAGGKRPEMKDVNGVYNLLSAAIRSLQAYYGIYNEDFATGISGYPAQALVQDSSGNFWISTADNNLTTPGASGASWKSLFDGYAQLDKYANFYGLSTTNTLPLYDNGNNVPTTYWVKAQGYALSSDIPSLAGYAKEDWVNNKGYTTLSGVAAVGYVTGTTSTNVSVNNIQAVNYTGNDNTAAYLQVTTPVGSFAIPSNSNIAGQISNYAQPKGSYVTTDNYNSDFNSSDSRIQFFAYGKMQIFENIGTVSDGARVTFPRAFSGTPVVIGVPYDNADINGHPYSPDSEGFYVHKNGGGTINFTYIAIGPK